MMAAHGENLSMKSAGETMSSSDQAVDCAYRTHRAFGGLAIPPGKFKGALVKKKDHLFRRLHTSASSSKSNISPTGIPNKAMRLSCRPEGQLSARRRRRSKSQGPYDIDRPWQAMPQTHWHHRQQQKSVGSRTTPLSLWCLLLRPRPCHRRFPPGAHADWLAYTMSQTRNESEGYLLGGRLYLVILPQPQDLFPR